MDKQKILAAISLALDELAKEPEHLVAGLDLRNVKNEQFRAEIHVEVENGQMMMFHFLDVPNYERECKNREANMKMYRD